VTTVSPEQGDIMPNADIQISDTFAHDTFGILVNAAYSSNRTLGNHVNNQGWIGTYLDPCQRSGAAAACGGTLTPDATPAWFDQDYGIYQETTTETRYNGRLALQWKPTDAVVVTLNDNFSRDVEHAVQYGYSVWFNSGSLRNVTTDSQGTITSFVQSGSPTDFQSQINQSIIQNNEYGLNVKWQASPRLSFQFDADQSLAQLNPGGQLTSIDADIGYGPSTPGGTNGSNLGLILPGGHNLPYLVGIGPNGNAANFLGTGILGSHVLPISLNQRVDKVQQLKVEGSWAESDHLKITAGYQYSGEHDDARNYDDFANNDWQAFAGYGPSSNNNGTHGVALPASLITGSIPIGPGFIQPAAGTECLQSLCVPELSAEPGQSAGHHSAGLQRRLLHAALCGPVPDRPADRQRQPGDREFRLGLSRRGFGHLVRRHAAAHELRPA
jgi:iron complex outermembrane receptor protein